MPKIGRQRGYYLEGEIVALDDYNSNSESSEIPVLGKIAAGTPVEAIQNEVSRVPLPTNIEKNVEYSMMIIKISIRYIFTYLYENLHCYVIDIIFNCILNIS